MSILNPAGHALAYFLRSISLLRYKDRDKAPAMLSKVSSDPVFLEQMQDGPFKDWRRFAEDIAKLTDKEASKELIAAWRASRFDAFVSRYKSKGLRIAESNEFIIKLAQRGRLQDVLGPALGAK